MNVVCILLDSLNRHFLPAYGNDWVLTPNLQRLQQQAVDRGEVRARLH